MKLRKMSLDKMAKDYPLELKKVRKLILIGLKELVCTSDYWRTHGDLKLTNILVDFDLDVNGTLKFDKKTGKYCFDFCVTDFGAAGWLEMHFGGTPGYAAPTTFVDSQAKDIYAFTRITMDLYMDVNHSRQLSLLPIESVDALNTLRNRINHPLLRAICDVTQSGTSNNIGLTVDEKECLCQNIIDRADDIELDHEILDLIAAQMRVQQMTYKLDNSGRVNMSQGSVSLQYYELYNQSNYMTGTYVNYNSCLGNRVYSQADSYKCWAFSTASMLSVTCLVLLKACCEDGIIDQDKFDSLKLKVKESGAGSKFHVHCRNLIMMVVLPKPIHRDTHRQSEHLKVAISRVRFEINPADKNI